MRGRHRADLLIGICVFGAFLLPLARAEDEAASRPKNREASLRRLCEELGVGAGATVADIGCGHGRDSKVFARIVGPTGTVFAEEIDAKKITKVYEETTKDKLVQVVPILGGSTDPRVPDRSTDLMYMCRVFHHFAKPRAMLAAMWQDLRPGGHLVIVDRLKGTLQNPVPLAEREKKHNWTGETAVVRLGRETGFLFVNSSYDVWHEKDAFVVILKRPEEGERATSDPEAAGPWKADWISSAIARHDLQGRRVACVALDRGRALVEPLNAAVGADGKVWDVVLDEWRITADEAPEVGKGDSVAIVRCDKGRIAWPDGASCEGAVFADSYHRVWKPEPLLGSLRDRLPVGGLVAVIDRRGPKDEPRRLANHRRRIDPGQVIEDFRAAGFEFIDDDRAPDDDRFVVWFRSPGPAPKSPEKDAADAGEAKEKAPPAEASKKKGSVTI